MIIVEWNELSGFIQIYIGNAGENVHSRFFLFVSPILFPYRAFNAPKKQSITFEFLRGELIRQVFDNRVYGRVVV